MAQIRHVRQEDASGCVVACLAMVTGLDYAEVKESFRQADGSLQDFNKRGIGMTRSDEYLTRSGYALRRVTHFDPIAEQHREPWPPAPFTDVHICDVLTSRSHMVVMLRDGMVLDPLTDEPRRLSDYSRVFYVAGVYRVD